MNDASARQIKAANPAHSSWVAANAGSGKTRVLIDRVARLLLEGVRPEYILCLTYTKAAASEMQNRLFARLGAWAMKPDDALVLELEELGSKSYVDTEQLTKARRLFANAIEAPGGLKIQTIHSFCASILRRFPLEAGVSPQFTAMDETDAQDLRLDVVNAMAKGANADLVEAVASFMTDADFGSLTASILKERRNLIEGNLDFWASVFDVDPHAMDQDWLLGQLLSETDLAFLRRLPTLLMQGSTNDQKLAKSLSAINTTSWSAWQSLEAAFLTGAKAKSPFSAKIGSVPTKSLQNGAMSGVLDDLNTLMERVESGRVTRISALNAKRTHALNAFGLEFLAQYQAAKQRGALLDYDDQIDKTAALLSNSTVAQWVLYRLDGGIEHILVDEAQDTSPTQWQVIDRLTEEMTAGDGSGSQAPRSLFVVGDPKQSIYSFQGADPSGFTRMREIFGNRLIAAQRKFEPIELEYSFRSAPPILALVDRVFGDANSAGMGGAVFHRAYKSDLPGRVDLWPLIPTPEKQDDIAWSDPVDRRSALDAPVVLARKIAAEIGRWLREGVCRPKEIGATGLADMQPIDPGDILILVRKRSVLFEEIIRACKTEGIPIAGADRVKLLDVLAVRDVVALLSFLSNQDDDLALAEALRSPLFGWSEQDLFSLAAYRGKKPLWQALREANESYPKTLNMLTDLRNRADFLRPYELIERALTFHQGREKLLGRLGIEAEEGLDALLSVAMQFEEKRLPTLTGFIEYLTGHDIEIKRELSTATNELRVMTIHGAKGLEAPIVILPDCGEQTPRRSADLVESDGHVLWPASADEQTVGIQNAIQTNKALEEQERDRLLYVAMTRAEHWLIVAGFGELRIESQSWFARIEAALDALDAPPNATPSGPGLRFENEGWRLTHEASRSIEADETPELISFDPIAEYAEETIISPSMAPGAKSLPGEAERFSSQEEALLYGSAVHQLLENDKGNADTFAEILEISTPGLEASARAAATNEALSVINAPALGAYFENSTLTEVPITASVPDLGGQRVTGIIDRLIVTDERIIAADFKTNAVIPNTPEEVPDGLKLQMALYGAALTEIYPGRDIHLVLIWTRTQTAMELPLKMVRGLLQTAAKP